MSHVPIPLDKATPLWQRVFTVAPLVVVGTKEGDRYNLAPKHMVVPLGTDNYIGFVCTPAHATFQNIQENGFYTISFIHPSQVIIASLAASSRVNEAGDKPGLLGLPMSRARTVDCVLVDEAYLQLECELEKFVGGFGEHSLIAGRVVDAYADERALRISDADEQRVLLESPLIAYVHPGRFAKISETYAFPFPASALD